MLLRRALLALGLIFVWCGGARAQRLPGGVHPEHYALTITPDLQKATFVGSERIDVVLDAPTKAITLNAAELEFGSVRAWVSSGIGQGQQQIPFGNDKQESDDTSRDAAQAATVTLDVAKEQATFTFAQALPAGPVTVQIEYTGILNNKLRGFYLSKTKARNYGVTQFEATDARRAFPGFDEPALKSTFDVTLVVDTQDTAISNTRMVSDRPGPEMGKHTLRFATTPKMSTYLVAWLVGDFVCRQGKADGVPIRACATPDKVALTKFALDAAKATLKYYDRYFGIKYPMAKLDMVAIPDFEAGAMENFGCITYRETEMLVDAKNGTLPARKDVATTVAHEIAHQWFGDLVTPAWWDNLWLNEGFATWMETKAAAKWQPKWKYDQDEAQDLNRTLDDDAARTTRAIRTRAETPAEINELFDDIAYGKAGAVIGMVENWIGEEVFRKGVQAYLAAHLYGNATAEDFWNAQARVSGLPVDKVMRSFVEQPGVPLVTVAGTDMTQRPFSLSTASKGVAADILAKPGWTIPVCFIGAPCRLLQPGQTSIDVPMPVSSAPFLYANAGAKGYYRTAYSAKEWAALVAHAESGLTAPEQIGLLGDRWALMRAGQGTVGEFLDLVLALKTDPSAAVLQTAVGRVGTIESWIATDDDRQRLEAIMRREFSGVYAALSDPAKKNAPPKHEPYDHAELRETLFETLGRAKDPAVLAQAASITGQLLSGQKPADPMLGDSAIALTTPGGGEDMYDSLLKVTRNAKDPDLKEASLHVLARFESPALVARTLDYALTDEVRSQDAWALIALLLERRSTQEQAWAFVEQHWPEIQRKSTVNSGARIVEAAGAFCTVEKRDVVAAFFHTHPVESSDRTLAKSLDSIDDCIRLRAAQEPALRTWLDGHGAS